MDNEAREIAEDHAVAAGMKDLIRQATARNPRPHIPGAKAMSDLKERLRARGLHQEKSSAAFLCYEAADRIEQLEAALNKSTRLREVSVDLAASLTAAVSILRHADEGNGNVRKVVASNTMFHMMLKDYEASLERARQVLGDT